MTYAETVQQALYGLVKHGVEVVLDLDEPCFMVEEEIAHLYATYATADEGEEWRNKLINASVA